MSWTWMIRDNEVYRRLPNGEIARTDMVPIKVLATLEDKTESAIRQRMRRLGLRAYNGCINYRKYRSQSEGVAV